MPSPKSSLDLGGWSNLPQERANDYEYNLLLYKYKTLYNEVKDFQRLHTNCSVSRAVSASGLAVNNSLGALPSANNNDNNSSKTAPTQSNGQQVTSGLNKRFIFQHQKSAPVSCSSVGAGPNGSKQVFPMKQQEENSTSQHFNSGYNLHSLNNAQKNAELMRPEIRQRNNAPNSRLLLTKSSERLDRINNNHLQFASSLKNRDLIANNFTSPVARDSKYTLDDDNIYDAVYPDDTPTSETSKVASSINNLNRLSLSGKNRLDTSKSLLGLGSSADASRGISKVVSNSKSVPNENTEQEKSNNSFSSSLISDATNHSSSSLSLLPSLNKDQVDESPSYSNYVNIDFFLKRGGSPSFDGAEGEATNDDSSEESDEDTTQLSNSLSSNQNCSELHGEISPHDLAKKLSSKDNNSSNSISPSSSGDILEEQRNSSSLFHQSPSSVKHHETNKSASDHHSFSNLPSDSPTTCKISTSLKEIGSKNSSPQQVLESIRENATNSIQHTVSLDPSRNDKSGNALAEAQSTMRSFLSDLNLSSIHDVFEDKAQRRIVKESFAVEFCGRRKLRHLFLFNDVIVCAKYQASSKQKFTFDVKWYLNLNGVTVLDLNDVNHHAKYDREAIENQILAIRTNLMLLRGQMQHIKRSENKRPSKLIKKLKKKRTELEAELVLLLPHLPLLIKHVNGKKYTFFLSSNFDRNQWVESIKFLQSQLSPSKGTSSSPSSSELQAWIQTCRKNLNPSLGTFLLRSNCDDDLLYGDLYLNLNGINGLTKSGQYYFCFEVDSYGHFSQKASSPILRIDSTDHQLNEEYVFPLDGTHTLRILLYEDLGSNAKPSVIGKAIVELSRSWFLDKPVDKVIVFNSNCSLKTQLSYSSSELLSMRVPHTKLCPTFGMDITQVCKKEKTNVPLLIQLCVNEVERRGMRDVGIYRMSGTSTDIQRLKKAFETNPYVAELLLRDIDINSVTGFLKTYLREIPEGLFSNKLYLKFVAAFNIPQSNTLERIKTLLELFRKIPVTNQHTIIYLVDHLVNVNKFESHNKMSLTNLATVFGPNILKAPTDSSRSNSDPFTAVVIGSMSQAGILYFFLNRKFSKLPLTDLDPSELERYS